MSKLGPFTASSQSYLYGKKHFTRTGWRKHSKRYEQPDLLWQELDLSGRVYMITGANSGIGREIAEYFAGRHATVFMVCRNRERAEATAAEIRLATDNSHVHVLEADVGLESDVRRVMRDFAAHPAMKVPRLDALVCNAGAISRTKTLTSEGVESTIASHLIFGTYLLGSLAMPTLEATPGSRFIAVSGSSMYNVAFPSWDVATSTQSEVWGSPPAIYDGLHALCYANRGKVLLCERWAKHFRGVKVVSCHPGWVNTPYVEALFGRESKRYFEPMRTPWEGAEGIAWLCVAPGSKIVSGSLYLDRQPQPKHMAGAFFSEGTHTKNTCAQIDELARNLDDWANGRRPAACEHLRSDGRMRLSSGEERDLLPASDPLRGLDGVVDLERFMGRWYIIADIAAFSGRTTMNHTEEYFYDKQKETVMVDFSYSDTLTNKTSHLFQQAILVNYAGSEWRLTAQIGARASESIPFVIAHLAHDYSSAIVGVPDRSYIGIMTRVAYPDDATVEGLMKRAEELGYDVSKISAVEQEWSTNSGVATPEVVQDSDPEVMQNQMRGELVADPELLLPVPIESILGTSEHGTTAKKVSTFGPLRCLLVLFFSCIGALVFAGLSATLSSDHVPFLVGIGVVLGLVLGVGVDVFRHRRGARPAREVSGNVMDGMQNAKTPLVDIENASTAAGSSFANTSLSASIASSSRG